MATVHRLGAIRICTYIDDHNPPPRLGDRAAQVKIADLSLLAGDLPAAALRRVLAWAADHQEFLAAEWAKRN